jgi:MFS family permease
MFRRLWIGNSLSSLGSSLTTYAVVLQVFRLTHSSFSVGLVGLCYALPSIIVALAGSALVDRIPKRTIILVGTSIQALISTALTAQAFHQSDSTLLLYGLLILQGLVSGLNAPAKRALVPALLDSDQLAGGSALQMMTMHAARMFGPALAGLLTAALGLRYCYLIDAVSFLVAIIALSKIRVPLPTKTDKPQSHLRSVLEGLRFVHSTKVIFVALLSDTSAMFLAMPLALFPAINAERFGGDPTTLGLMSSALAVGGVLGSLLSGPLGRVSRQGVAMLIAAGLWSIAIAGFALSSDFAVALLFLGVAGGGDVTSVIMRSAILQRVTPPTLMGRVSAAEFAVGAGMPQLGSFRAGVVGSLTTPTFGVLSGGLTSLAAIVLIALSSRSIRTLSFQPTSQRGDEPSLPPVAS